MPMSPTQTFPALKSSRIQHHAGLLVCKGHRQIRAKRRPQDLSGSPRQLRKECPPQSLRRPDSFIWFQNAVRTCPSTGSGQSDSKYSVKDSRIGFPPGFPVFTAVPPTASKMRNLRLCLLGTVVRISSQYGSHSDFPSPVAAFPLRTRRRRCSRSRRLSRLCRQVDSLCLSAASTTFRAARSIRTRGTEVPIVPIVYASAAFIVLPSMIYFMPYRSFPRFHSSGFRKRTRSPASVVRISHVPSALLFFLLVFFLIAEYIVGEPHQALGKMYVLHDHIVRKIQIRMGKIPDCPDAVFHEHIGYRHRLRLRYRQDRDLDVIVPE